jgi:predicted dehydrogenase
MPGSVRAGIIGMGFMGRVHAHAIRAAGGQVVAVAGSTPAHSQQAARRLGQDCRAETLDGLLESPDIDIVHVCTPNYLHASQALAAVEAGKHVICEKPLAVSEAEARELAAAAATAGVTAAVPFVYRFYPAVREARARIARGEAGELRVLHGSYLQDWLASSADSDWRVSAALGGPSRAFGDIGVHWCDLVEFTTGHRITRLAAHLLTAHADRGPSAGGSGAVSTEDVATLLFQTDQGAIGSAVMSQITLGRKNRLWISLDGDRASLSFDQELPESLWIGGKDASTVILRGSEASSPDATRYSTLPPGHPQGYQDSFNAFVADAYRAMQGDMPDGLPTFEDGWRAAAITSAVLLSAQSQSWVEVPWPSKELAPGLPGASLVGLGGAAGTRFPEDEFASIGARGPA